MNAVLTNVDAAVIEAEIARLKAELDRRKTATDKVAWARGKASECRDQAAEIARTPTKGKPGKESSQARISAMLRAQAREWDKKADRFEQEAGIAAPAYTDPF